MNSGLRKSYIPGLFLLFLMLFVAICLSACGSGKQEEDIPLQGAGASEYSKENDAAPADGTFQKEIIYTRTSDIVPEWYIQFDVNPSVGFYVDEEQGYPVCGLIYNNRDAKELLEEVRIVDGPLADSYASLYFNLVRAGYFEEDQDGKHINIAISYYKIGKLIEGNEYEIIPIENPKQDEKIDRIDRVFSYISEGVCYNAYKSVGRSHQRSNLLL